MVQVTLLSLGVAVRVIELAPWVVVAVTDSVTEPAPDALLAQAVTAAGGAMLTEGRTLTVTVAGVVAVPSQVAVPAEAVTEKDSVGVGQLVVPP